MSAQGSDVRTTISADSSGYEEAFSRATKAHNAFFESEQRVKRDLVHFTESLLHAKSGADVATAAFLKLTRVMNLGAVIGTSIAVFSQIYKTLKEDAQQADALEKSFEKAFRTGSNLGQTTSSMERIKSSLSAAEQSVEAIDDRLKEMNSRPVRSFIVEMFAMPGNETSAQMNRLNDERNAMLLRIHNTVGLIGKEEEATTKQLQLQQRMRTQDGRELQITYEYEQKILKAKEENARLEKTGADVALGRERIRQLEKQRDLALQMNRTSSQERTASAQADYDATRVFKLKEAHQATEAKRLEIMLAAEAKIRSILQGKERDPGAQEQAGYVLSDAGRQIAELNRADADRQKELRFELSLENMRSGLRDKTRSILEAELTSLKAKAQLEKDVTAQQEIQLSIAQKKNQLAEYDRQTRKQRLSLNFEATTLDIAGNTKLTDTQKRDYTQALKLQEILSNLSLARTNNEKLEGANQLRELRNSIVNQTDRSRFSVDSLRAVGGGGRIGSGGDPLLAQTKTQTDILTKIHTALVNLKPASSAPVMRP